MGMIADFLAKVQSVHKTGIAREHAYRPALSDLLYAVAKDITPVNGVTTRKWRICPTFKNVSGIQVGLTVDVVAFSALRAS